MAVIRVAAAPPPSVIFSTPIAGEDDVLPTSGVRIQFSRDMDPKTFRDKIRLSYGGPAPQGAAAAPPTFTFRYNEGNRALEIKLSAPLDRFRTVKVELLEGILSNLDNQPLAPYTLTFTTGG